MRASGTTADPSAGVKSRLGSTRTREFAAYAMLFVVTFGLTLALAKWKTGDTLPTVVPIAVSEPPPFAVAAPRRSLETSVPAVPVKGSPLQQDVMPVPQPTYPDSQAGEMPRDPAVEFAQNLRTYERQLTDNESAQARLDVVSHLRSLAVARPEYAEQIIPLLRASSSDGDERVASAGNEAYHFLLGLQAR